MFLLSIEVSFGFIGIVHHLFTFAFEVVFEAVLHRFPGSCVGCLASGYFRRRLHKFVSDFNLMKSSGVLDWFSFVAVR